MYTLSIAKRESTTFLTFRGNAPVITEDLKMNTQVAKFQRLFWTSCLLPLIVPVLAHGEGSILFDGLDSRLMKTDADVLAGSSNITVCVWVWAAGLGENNLGTILRLDEDGSAILLGHPSSANTLHWVGKFTGGNGEWTFPVTDGTWRPVSVTYNKSNPANDPVARVNFADVTETEVASPNPMGSPQAINTGYCVGNDSTQVRTWNGKIAHLQVFDRILSTTEQDAALQAPGSIRNGLRLWLPMNSATDVNDRSGNGLNGTATTLFTDISGPMVTGQPGVLPGDTILNAGWVPVTQHVIPRYANGVSHPAGKLRGQGPGSVIQGTTYGPEDGSNPHEIVVTEDWTASIMRQWDNGPNQMGEVEAVLQPVVRDLSILGKVDAEGYADSKESGTDIVNSNTPGVHNPRFPHGDAINFDGADSRLQNTTADVLNGANKVTFCCWINPDGLGENDNGYLFILDEQDPVSDTAAFIIKHDDTDDQLTIVKKPGPAGSEAVWDIPITDDVWNAVCVRLDFSGDNPPTVRVNYRPVAVPAVFGSGIQDLPATGYCVGNRNAQDRTWDGRIAQVQVFNTILTDAEADSALIAPGSVTSGRRLWLPMTSGTDVNDDSGNNFHGTPTPSPLASGENWHDHESGLAIRASGPRVEDVSFFHIAGTCLAVHRDSNNLTGPIQPFDREFATLEDLTAYRAYSGFLIATIDTEVGNIEAQYLRDWGLKVPACVGGVKFEGAVHLSGIRNGVAAPAAYGTAAWFAFNAGPCFGSGPWYCETADVGMRIESSGNKFTNFFSHSCTYRNLWFDYAATRNSVANFEIQVENGVTEAYGGEGVLLGGSANMLSNGTILGDEDANFRIPAGEIAVRMTKGVRQTIRDVDFIGTSGSSAPLISVECNALAPFNDSGDRCQVF
jgi:hypothetical protein